MATIKNYRDALLQAAPARGINLPSAALLLVASTPAFHVAIGGAADPVSISFVATLVDLKGAITFSASGATLTSVTANSAVVTYANMPGSTATVTASVTVNGTVFSKTVPIAKVVDGANGSNGSNGSNGAAGADGLNSATVFIYQRNNTGGAPALPSANSTYTFSTGGLTGLNNGWSVAVPAASGGAFLFMSKAIALSTTATDVIPAAEWSAATVMAQNGADALANLVNVGWWQRDATIPWTKNQEYNRIVMTGTDVAGVGPKGQADFVWYCEETANNNNEGGGWEITPVTLDPTKTYRFAVPIKRLFGTASAYWGTGNVCTLNTATVASNPYFVSASGLTIGRWYLFVGYLFPAGSTGNTNSGAGIYDCETGLLISPGVNYNMQAAVATYYHRCYQFYGSNGAQQIMGRPMINLVDGAEPSLREYFSAAAVLNANQLWSDVSGTGKPSDNATSDINLIGNGVSVVGNKLVKSAATTAWDSDARSIDSYAGGAFVSAVVGETTTQLMFALNTDPGLDSSYTSLDYAIYIVAGTLRAYESNVSLGPFGSYAVGDVLSITYDGAYVRYMKNGVVFRSVAAVIVAPLFFDSSFFNTGASLTNVRFGPLSQVGSSTPFITSGSHMSVQGSTISKIGGAVAWDEGAWSQESYTGGAACSFIPVPGAYFMAGLNTDPTTDNNYTSIDYCFYSDGSSNLYWYNSGATTGSFGTYVPGTDVLALTYDGQYVSWVKNGTVLKTLAAGPGVRFYFDASFAAGTLSNVKMGPMSAASTGIVFANSVGMSLSNGVFKKVGTTAVWDEQVISTDSFVGGAYASAKLISGYGAMFGLNTDPNANASYTSLDYAFYWEGGNVLKAYESNVDAGTIGTWAFGDILTISYDGVVVRYFQNGTLLRTVAAAYNLKFYFDSSFRDQGTSIGSVTFGPMSSTNWLAVGGDGKPSSYATVGPADAATSLGFNPQFSDWPTGQTFPTGWAYWSGGNAAVKETATFRTGPYSVRYTVAGDTGAVASSYFASTPLVAGVYLRGSYDVYVVNHAGGTGKPGYLFRLYTNSALTAYRDTLVPALRNDVSGWQRVPFTANVNSGEQIYGITIYQMAAFSGMPGGAWANGSIVLFDNLAFEMVQPTTEAQVVIAQPAITGLTSYTAAKANGTNVSYGSRTATMTNGVAPFSYSWTCELEYGSNLYITGGSTSSIVAYGTGTNSYVIGTIGVTVTDANGKTAIGSLSVYVPHGTAVPP